MRLELPFIYAHRFIIEKPVDLLFKIETLETASEEILNCDLWEVGEKPKEEVNVAILYAGYLTACRHAYKKPKYSETDAAFWITHMNRKSTEEFYKAIAELIGKMKSRTDKGEKKK